MAYGVPARLQATPAYLRRDFLAASQGVVDMTEADLPDLAMVRMEPPPPETSTRKLFLFGIPLVLIGLYAFRGAFR